MKIIVKKLKALRACEDQVQLFEKTFGPSVVVTEALCVRHADKFSWDWAARRFLSPKALEAYELAVARS